MTELQDFIVGFNRKYDINIETVCNTDRNIKFT